MTEIPLISIIDDDDLSRASVHELVRSLGFPVRTFVSAASFLQSTVITATRCLILDVQMPEMSGLSLQDHLARQSIDVPIIFITAFPDEDTKMQALNAGAICYLRKPLDLRGPLLRECIETALKGSEGPAPTAS